MLEVDRGHRRAPNLALGVEVAAGEVVLNIPQEFNLRAAWSGIFKRYGLASNQASQLRPTLGRTCHAAGTLTVWQGLGILPGPACWSVRSNMMTSRSKTYLRGSDILASAPDATGLDATLFVDAVVPRRLYVLLDLKYTRYRAVEMRGSIRTCADDIGREHLYISVSAEATCKVLVGHEIAWQGGIRGRQPSFLSLDTWCTAALHRNAYLVVGFWSNTWARTGIMPDEEVSAGENLLHQAQESQNLPPWLM